MWEENTIHFPYTIEDIEAMMENQKNYRISIKNLSNQYRNMLEYLLLDMIPDINMSNLKRVIKNLEREG